jgi:hypothetical protein
MNRQIVAAGQLLACCPGASGTVQCLPLSQREEPALASVRGQEVLVRSRPASHGNIATALERHGEQNVELLLNRAALTQSRRAAGASTANPAVLTDSQPPRLQNTRLGCRRQSP